MKPWKKAVPREAMLEREENMVSGIRGYLATRPSMGKKRAMMISPNMIRHMTVAEAHGKVTPPNSSPMRNITVPPTIAKEPIQSIVLRPATTGVRGL